MSNTPALLAAAQPIDDFVDVVIVGAGLSGIGAACHLMRERPQSTFAVLEARTDLGGTWDLFRYPGIRSDSDMFTLGYSFRPWQDRRAIADGPSILEYLRETAAEYGIDQRIRYGHRVLAAEWKSGDARWIVTVEMTQGNGTVVTTRIGCRWLSVCAGYYRYDQGHRPHFEGEETFSGEIVSPQTWPEDLDWTGKQVTVIGSGATAITLVPTLAKKARHVTMLQRTPSYIVSVPAEDSLVKFLEKVSAPATVTSRLMFWKNVLSNILSYETARRFPRFTRRLIHKETERELGRYLDVGKHFNPPYNPWDQRVCAVPDGDLFEAIRNGRAEIITDTINRFVSNGIETKSGKVIESDIVVAATGLQMAPLGGMSLSVDGRAVSLPDSLVYKGMMLSHVPNFNLVIGYTNNSWTLKADLVSKSIAQLISYLDKRGFDYVKPHPPANAGTIPFVDLHSGYVQRAITAFPKQGTRTPWRLHQNYLFDLRLFRNNFDKDPALEFYLSTASRKSGHVTSNGKVRSMPDFDFSGTAIVTGAAGGIGRALAKQLAERGSDIVLVDRDVEGLHSAIAELKAAHPHSEFTSYVADLTNREEVRNLGETLSQNHPSTRLLVNNAGVALSGAFEQSSKEDFDWLLAVNLLAPIDLVRTLLPVLQSNQSPHIVNISSVFGLIAPAGNVAYATSKFGLRGFTEALRAELAPSGIGVTCVHPGGIKTNISLGARIGSVMTSEERAAAEKSNVEFDKVLTITAETAAQAIVAGIAHRRRRVLIGASAKIPDILARLFPAHYHRIVDILESTLGWLSSLGQRRNRSVSNSAERIAR
ncbi:SDR family NAD(P)-dependent oxidoreductase [Agrobacterium sp. LAD9]|uniref:SDR family NAD(P)-dependent oxidoreductase n=1 Tax=Agrobacterium sp. LAD9 TaxID=2055153 RepID=UPI000D1F6050|nr:SDR family NAD(P)-dependent oxidoreductase [Agrobacterium sp. LAD9]